MKNKIQIKQAVEEAKEPVDITKLFIEFSQKYRNVFVTEIDGQTFIYRALGRAEFREILSDTRFNDYQKEELMCSQCMLYPDPDEYDWDDKEAGLPSQLKQEILKDSFLDDLARRRSLHDYYRSEMYDLANQITCIINEAFPNYDIEEIEKWDVEKTTKYLSRAEWKLHNLHGLEFKEPEGQFYGEENLEEKEAERSEIRNQPKKADEKADDGSVSRNNKRDKKSKLTLDKMKEREEFLKKFPEFAHDDVMEQGIDGLAQDDVDDRPPALRPGWY